MSINSTKAKTATCILMVREAPQGKNNNKIKQGQDERGREDINSAKDKAVTFFFSL